MRVRSEWLRVCLLEIFQCGGLEDMMQLLEDCWSDSRTGCAALRSPGGAYPRRMVLHQLASMVCNDEYRGIVIDV